jgi:glycosyltransferase involved in cell wall biosynthesis
MSPRPRVEAVPSGVPRPRWSVMIPTYNCADYLVETLASVLFQDPGPARMQIEVVDDHSSDDPEIVVRRYGGRVGFYRQPRNVGHIANLNTCLARSTGEIVHVLHGDDAVRPGFYAALEPPFTDPRIGAAFCRFIAIDGAGHWTTVAPLEAHQDGVIEDWLERIAGGQRIQTPAIVVRRTLYESLGGFDDRVGDAEDWEMWTRIAAHSSVWHVVEPLALYRIRSDSLSRGTLRTGHNVENLRRVIDLNRDVLPPERRDEITRIALDTTALTALQRARRLLGAGDAEAARAQFREAIRTSRSPAVLERAVELVLIQARRGIHRGVKSLTRRPGQA